MRKQPSQTITLTHTLFWNTLSELTISKLSTYWKKWLNESEICTPLTNVIVYYLSSPMNKFYNTFKKALSAPTADIFSPAVLCSPLIWLSLLSKLKCKTLEYRRQTSVRNYLSSRYGFRKHLNFVQCDDDQKTKDIHLGRNL